MQICLINKTLILPNKNYNGFQIFKVNDVNGEIIRFIGVFKDITDRRKMESELLHSSNIDAIGQMTGGVAHDFNNLLALIMGNLMLLDMDIEEGEEIKRETLKENTADAVKASKLGTDLTKQLLAFSRNTALEVKTIEINQIVNNCKNLLMHTLPRNIDVKFNLDITNPLVLVDPTYLESAILNLSINASDAMQYGGELVIETDVESHEINDEISHLELTAGEYVRLIVRDTGIGMDSTTIKKAFEPFFTTKELGKGTGLGLSSVYGFVKQSGGNVTIESEIQKGTSIKIYLPLAEDSVTEEVLKKTIKTIGVSNKTILVIEDEVGVQNYMLKLLKRSGYNTLMANDAETAIKMVKSNKSIDLLLTDIILTGLMNGIELARKSYDMRNELKILYMSGYTKEYALSDKI